MNLLFPLRSAFLAIPLEGPAKWEFQALQEALRQYEDILSFQNPQSPHLTLQFWPTVMEIEYGQILKQSERVAVSHNPFSCRISGVDTFGSHGEDRVLYLAVPFSEELARFKKSCPWPAAQPFCPHITIARINHPQRFHVVKKKILKASQSTEFSLPVTSVRFYAEVDGRKQTPLNDFPLHQNQLSSSGSPAV